MIDHEQISNSMNSLAFDNVQMMTDLQDGTKKMYENTKKAGSDRINNLLLTRLGMALTTSVDTALLLSEFAVDYYLPAENSK